VSVLRAIFSRQWLLATFLVVVGSLVMARLGLWQLDRLEQRREFNARVQAQIEAQPLSINQAIQSDSADQLAALLPGMEYRKVQVEGEYDHSQEVTLRNQAWNNQLGVRLLTPLKISGSEAWIIVDRGWVPYEDFTAGRLDQYAEPGIQQVEGILRRSQTRPDIGRRTDPEPGESGERLEAFFLANIERISTQVSYPLLPAYIQQAPQGPVENPPHRSAPIPQLTEGSHLGYAMQWFIFALILAGGYPFFVKREMEKEVPDQGRKSNKYAN
jgi:surfeit locus 1 family protein